MITIDNDVKLDYSDVLLVPGPSDSIFGKVQSRNKVNLLKNFFDLNEIVPIFAANMDHVGTFNMARELSKHSIMTCLVKHYDLDHLVQFYTKEKEIAKFTAYSLGSNPEDIKKFKEFNELIEDLGIDGPPVICLDVANAYTTRFLDVVEELAADYPSYVLMAGNVVTPKITEKLIESGVDIVKIGIGPGSVCTTRRETGIGYPQFSAVLECSAAAKSVGGQICADGGITCPGDVVKALAAGAGYVMVGGQFAGHDEGYTVEQLQEDKIPFYGMASEAAQTIHNGGLKEYRASEGKIVHLPKKGSISRTIQQYLGGIRSACAYMGCSDLDELQKSSHFIRTNRQLNGIFS